MFCSLYCMLPAQSSLLACLSDSHSVADEHHFLLYHTIYIQPFSLHLFTNRGIFPCYLTAQCAGSYLRTCFPHKQVVLTTLLLAWLMAHVGAAAVADACIHAERKPMASSFICWGRKLPTEESCLLYQSNAEVAREADGEGAHRQLSWLAN